MKRVESISEVIMITLFSLFSFIMTDFIIKLLGLPGHTNTLIYLLVLGYAIFKLKDYCLAFSLLLSLILFYGFIFLIVKLRHLH